MPAHATMRAHRWEELVAGRSRPAPGVTVAEWRHAMSRLPDEELHMRMCRPNKRLFHPVRLGLKEEHVKTLLHGGTVMVTHSMTVDHHRHGELVHLTRAMAARMLRATKEERGWKLRLTEGAVRHNIIHGGHLFSSLADFGNAVLGAGQWALDKLATTDILDKLGDALGAVLPGKFKLIAQTTVKALKAAAKLSNNYTKDVEAAAKKREAAEKKLQEVQEAGRAKEAKLIADGAARDKVLEFKSKLKQDEIKLRAQLAQAARDAGIVERQLEAARKREVKLAEKAAAAVEKARQR